ncbi:MAG: uroporphyrinogen decarboxylase family protein [Anaerolineae bacterium]
MTQRERLLAVFRGEKPERIPWCADLTYYQEGQAAWGTLPEQYHGADGLMRLHRDLGVGRTFYVRPVVKEERDPSLFSLEEVHDGDYVRQTWHTPEGTLIGLRKYAGGASLAWLEYPVKTITDVPAMCAWFEGARYSPTYEGFYQSEAEWGENGYPFIGTARTPLAEFIVGWAGVANFSYMAADAPDELDKAFRRLREAQAELWQLYAHAPGLVIEIGDNLSATVQASFFRRYSYDYYQHLVGLMHAADKKLGVHIDGTLRGLLHLLPQAGLDFVESVTPAPVGDMDCEQIRQAVGSECIIIGGVPGAMFAHPFTWPEVRDHVRLVMQVLGRDGHFILGAADQVPPDGDIELVQRISEEVDSFVMFR